MDKKLTGTSPKKLNLSMSGLPTLLSESKLSEKENEIYQASQENLKEHSLLIE